MEAIYKSHGFVLSFILVLILSLSILLMVFLQSMGNTAPFFLKRKEEFQNFYNKESALILYLNGYPENYYSELPHIQSSFLGPWKKVCAGDPPLCLLLGTKWHDVSFSDWVHAISNYQDFLEKQILNKRPLKRNGNRRFFEGNPKMNFQIFQGDLELNFSDSIFQGNFWVDGSVLVKGNVHFDTLRIYSLGNVTFKGEVSIEHLELFTKGFFLSEDNVQFKGMVLSSSFALKENTYGRFPTVILALGDGVPHGEVLDKAKVMGIAEAAGGFLNIADSMQVKKTILPSFFDGDVEVLKRWY